MVGKRANPAERPSRPKWGAELSDREFRFVNEYLLDLNGTQAFIRSGLSKPPHGGATRQAACVMLQQTHVAKAVDAALQADASGPRQWLVTKLAAIADADIFEFCEYDKKGRLVLKPSAALPRELRVLVKKIVSTKSGPRIELHDPLRAIEILAKVASIGLTQDKIGFDGQTLEQLVMMAQAKKDEAK